MTDVTSFSKGTLTLFCCIRLFIYQKNIKFQFQLFLEIRHLLLKELELQMTPKLLIFIVGNMLYFKKDINVQNSLRVCKKACSKTNDVNKLKVLLQLEEKYDYRSTSNEYEFSDSSISRISKQEKF